ncbi:unnamed protein product [Diabrotica balteata]|uniref:SIAH-type domain-containing protein n=1 Tax=Diabrotica balteata TaxID=107213 RepID=A0A9N9SJQ9_DIABA|nr:unnamed protein product [Diabrotica balteata]
MYSSSASSASVDSSDSVEFQVGSSSEDEDPAMEEATLRQLRCPICHFIMKPPILRCTLSHCFCYACYVAINRCSLCASPKVYVRNLPLESKYYKVSLPCKYADNGCTFKARHKYLRHHQKKCTFTIKGCPFNFTSLCSWAGTVYELLDHCMDLHHYTYSTKAVNRLCYQHFDTCHHSYRMYMIFAHNCYFRLTLFVDMKCGWLKFACYYLGHRKHKTNFTYEMKFLKENTENKAIALKQKCRFLINHDLAFGRRTPMSLPINVLKEICDSMGDLHYVVTIFNNDDPAVPSTSTSSTSS